MQNMPPKGVVVVFTDAPTKNYNLESEINSYKNVNDLDVIFALVPTYNEDDDSGTWHHESWQIYDRLSGGKIFIMEGLNGNLNSNLLFLTELILEVSKCVQMKC